MLLNKSVLALFIDKLVQVSNNIICFIQINRTQSIKEICIKGKLVINNLWDISTLYSTWFYYYYNNRKVLPREE